MTSDPINLIAVKHHSFTVVSRGLTCMLIRISRSVLVIGRPPSSQWRRWMSWARSVSSAWQRVSSDRSQFRDLESTHKHFAHVPTKDRKDHVNICLFSLSQYIHAFCHCWVWWNVTQDYRWFWPLEVASISWVCCSQADTLLVTPGWDATAGAGLPISCWYTDAELA